MNSKTGRIVCFSLLVIGGVFLAVQATLLVQGHTPRSSAPFGIVASLCIIAASLLNIWLIRQKQRQRETSE